MPLFRRKDEFVRAERWSDPTKVPPAPRELLRLNHGSSWSMLPYAESKGMAANLKPVPSWIVEFPDGVHVSMGEKEFLEEYEEVTDKSQVVHHAWALLASRMLDALRPVFGQVANMDGPAKVRMMVDRLVSSEAKARMWDRLPSMSKRLGQDVSELLKAIEKEIKG